MPGRKSPPACTEPPDWRRSRRSIVRNALRRMQMGLFRCATDAGRGRVAVDGSKFHSLSTGPSRCKGCCSSRCTSCTSCCTSRRSSRDNLAQHTENSSSRTEPRRTRLEPEFRSIRSNCDTPARKLVPCRLVRSAESMVQRRTDGDSS